MSQPPPPTGSTPSDADHPRPHDASAPAPPDPRDPARPDQAPQPRLQAPKADERPDGRRAAKSLVKGQRIGRFKILSKLGQGAMGAVCLAEDITLKRQVALKLLPRNAENEKLRVWAEQFIREARSAAQLVHPHIVQIFEVGASAEHYFIAMEVLSNGTLEDMVKRHGPLDVDEACELGAQAADALAYAHEMGMIHRDIKPANLLRTKRGHVKLADFGLVHINDPTDGFELPFKAIGTPYYMAPEVARGRTSPQSDIFALGAVVWYLLTGKPPFELDSPKDVPRVHLEIPIADLRSLRPDVPESLVQTLEQALSYQPDDRQVSAEDLADAFRRHARSSGRAPMAEVEFEGSEELADLSQAAQSATMSMTASRMSATGAASPTDARSQSRRMTVLITVGAVALALVGVLIAVVASSLIRGGDDDGAQASASPGFSDGSIVEPLDPQTSTTPDDGDGASSPDDGQADAGTDANPADDGAVITIQTPGDSGTPENGNADQTADPQPEPAPRKPIAVLNARTDTIRIAAIANQSSDDLYIVAGRSAGAPNSAHGWNLKLDAGAGQTVNVRISGSVMSSMQQRYDLPGPHHLGGNLLVEGQLRWSNGAPQMYVGDPDKIHRITLPDNPVSPSDREDLINLAHFRRETVVEGVVADVVYNHSDKQGVITFKQTQDDGGVRAVYGDKLQQPMKSTFGQEAGAGLIGKRVRVTATPAYDLEADRVTLPIANTRQIEIVRPPQVVDAGNTGNAGQSNRPGQAGSMRYDAVRDFDAIVRAAQREDDSTEHTVTGVVTDPKRNGGGWTIQLRGPRDTDFLMVTFGNGTADQLTRAADVRSIDDMAGRRLAVTGDLEWNQPAAVPWVRVKDASQITATSGGQTAGNPPANQNIPEIEAGDEVALRAALAEGDRSPHRVVGVVERTIRHRQTGTIHLMFNNNRFQALCPSHLAEKFGEAHGVDGASLVGKTVAVTGSLSTFASSIPVIEIDSVDQIVVQPDGS